MLILPTITASFLGFSVNITNIPLDAFGRHAYFLKKITRSLRVLNYHATGRNVELKFSVYTYRLLPRLLHNMLINFFYNKNVTPVKTRPNHSSDGFIALYIHFIVALPLPSIY